MADRPCMNETELRRFVGGCAQRNYWHRADRRTREGRAQMLALARGWIEPALSGSGYRFTETAGQSVPPVLDERKNVPVVAM